MTDELKTILDEWGHEITQPRGDITRLRKNQSNGQKIKKIIDTQVDVLLNKSIKGRALSNVELQSLATCINILKLGFEEIDRNIGKVENIKDLSTKELKARLKKDMTLREDKTK